jgi:membrane protein implicated in regulation of membrane protease activity
MPMATTPDLVLRDVHAAASTPWWPPAPGWWLVFVLSAAALAILLAMAWRKRARRRAFERVFDATLADSPTPVARVAAISELLRRAARLRDPDADRYEGERWRAHLDAGAKQRLFEGESGALLLEGPFRRDVDAKAVAMLERRARQRYLEWMR